MLYSIIHCSFPTAKGAKAMSGKLNPDINRLILVTHKKPDDDSVCSRVVILKGYGLPVNGHPMVEDRFVPKGSKYTPTADEQKGIDDGTIIMRHLDVGGTDLDHHGKGFTSSTEMIAMEFWPDERQMPDDIRDLKKYANFRDSASEIGKPNEFTVMKQQQTNAYLRDARKSFNVPLRCIFDIPGPTFLSEIIHNMDGESDETVMLMGCACVQAWMNGKKNRADMQDYFEYFGDSFSIGRNGLPKLNVMVANKCPYSASKVRNHMRRKHYTGKRMKHLVLIEYDKTFNAKDAFSIMLTHNRSMVEGMKQLAIRLTKIFEKEEGKPFFHDSEAILHIPRPKKLQLNRKRMIALMKEYIHYPGQNPAVM